VGGTCADRRPLRALFRELFARNGQQHGLVVRGPMGMGVTTLLRALYRECDVAKKAILDLCSVGTPGDVLGELATQLDIRRFPSFQSARAAMSSSSRTEIRNMLQIGGRTTINIPGPDRESVRARHEVLTDRFLEDLEAALEPDEPVVLLLDGYGSKPDGTDGADEWIRNTLLAGAKHRRWLVLVIGGEVSPPLEPAHESWCAQRDLALFEEADVAELARLLGLSIDEKEIRLVHEGTGGYPREAAAFLDRLSRSRGRADG
jgi:hypothetical protein